MKKDKGKITKAEFLEIDDSKPKKDGQLFCPYCGEWRTFKVLPPLPLFIIEIKSDYDRCEGCTISTEDYYVKTVNKLWGFGSKSNNIKQKKASKTKKK